VRNEFDEDDLRPRDLKLTDAVTDLLDFSIVTWAVDPEKLAALLPNRFEPEVFTLDDGREVAFVSAVPFRDSGFHFRFAPFVKVSMAQINLRAYVLYRGERVVWFFGTLLSGFWNWIPHRVWNLPWYSADIRVDANWEDGSYSVTARSELSDVTIELSKLDAPFERLDGFDDQEHTALVLTHPLQGYYRKRDGELGSYGVWHDRLELTSAAVEVARVSLFETLGLIEPEQEPHSVLVMPKTTFQIFLPPRREPEVLRLLSHHEMVEEE
jgi:uncharacterized protein YqjF (DUF2071 family)